MTDKILHPGTDNFFLLAGPCVIEGERMALDIAETIAPLAAELNIPYIFKGSYRKANRSRLDSFTGIGDREALAVLKKIRNTLGIPVVTDIHSADEAMMASDFDVEYSDSGFPLPPDRSAGCSRKDRTRCQHQERSVSIAGVNALCRR